MHPSTWLLPLILVLGLSALLPLVYFSGTLDPQGNLEDFPVALVVEPQTVTGDAAESLASAISDNVDSTKFALDRIDHAELSERMNTGKVYGAILIPETFNAQLAALTQPAAGSEALTPPALTLYTNTRAGSLSVGLVTGNLSPVLTGAQQALGATLTQAVRSTGAPISAAEATVLATPFTVHTSAFDPLPSNTGLGTSAFYTALILVLLGFVGASTINPTIDSAIGFAPSELGPAVSRKPYLRISRLHTLLVKFGVITAAAPVAALIVVAIAGSLLGMPIAHPFILWLFATAVIAAIGYGALTIFLIFGGLGALVNMFFFVALAMTSSGGTVPIEATPPFFHWLATVEPMHGIVLGVKSILYFDATGASGLTEAWTRVLIGMGIGLILGIIVAVLYDRTRFLRHPVPELSETVMGTES